MPHLAFEADCYETLLEKENLPKKARFFLSMNQFWLFSYCVATKIKENPSIYG